MNSVSLQEWIDNVIKPEQDEKIPEPGGGFCQ